MKTRLFRDEHALEAYVAEEAKRRWGLESIHIKPAGDTGWPDRQFFVPGGRPLLIEFKHDANNPEPRQAYIHKFLRSIGYEIEVHDTAELALEAIARAMGAARLPEKGDKTRAR